MTVIKAKQKKNTLFKKSKQNSRDLKENKINFQN